jgi:hypothetical protein
LVGAGTGAVSTSKAAPAGDFVGTSDTQTVTNKTLTSTTNNVTAKGLFSATSSVDVSASNEPTAGQVLTATSSTAAVWQDVPGVANLSVFVQANTTTSSSSYSNMSGMTLTPVVPGTYFLIFDGFFSQSGVVDIGIRMMADGVMVAGSERVGGDSSDNMLLSTGVVTWTSGYIILQWKVASGTLTCNYRSFRAIRIC